MKPKPKDPTTVTHENIQAIYRHEKESLAQASWATNAARKITDAASSTWCILLHGILFAGWIIANLFMEWDPFPFVLLITVVSLESIFLSCFVLISQKDLAIEADRRHNLDLQINLLAEQESTAILRLLDKIAEKLGIPEEDRREVQLLSDDTDPTDVLEQIVEVERDK